MKGLCFVEPFYKIFIIVLYVYVHVHMYKHDKTIEFSYIIFKPKQIHVFLFSDLMGLPLFLLVLIVFSFKSFFFKCRYNATK